MEEKDFLYELAAEIVEEILNKVLRKSSLKRKPKELWTPNKKPKARDSLGALLSSAPKKQHKLTAEKQKAVQGNSRPNPHRTQREKRKSPSETRRPN